MFNKRLKQLRLARGLSLDGLAARMGGIVTKQAISKYERGVAKPTSVVLNKLASALAVKAAHLWSEPNISCTFIAYRKGSVLAKHEQLRVEAVVCQMLEERYRLQNLLREQRIDLPVQRFQIRTLNDTERYAKELRSMWNAGLEPIASVTDTLEDHSVFVMEIDANERFDGISAVAHDNEKNVVGAAVVSRKHLAGGRQRLNLAHELGHLVLKIPAGMDEEKAAYRFGGAFLAPDETLYRDVGKKRACIPAGELILLKKRFGISMQALIYRLHDLGIISDSHYRQWFKDISQLKWKKQEPSELEPEQPQWLRKSVLRSFAEDLISQEEAMKLLGEAAGQKKAPLSLVERRAFMNLPLEERRKILAKQAKEISDTIKPGETEDLETGEFLDD